MTDIALVHSVLGIRQGVLDAAEKLRAAGHDVRVVDLYGDRRTFDDYDTAAAHHDAIGFPELMRRGLEAVEPIPDGFVVAGWSNGAAVAEHIAFHRGVSGVVLFSGSFPLDVLGDLGADAWPIGVPAQIHFTLDDPYLDDGWPESVAASVQASGARCDVFYYPGAGHLFTDASLVDEFDPESTRLLWERVLPFVAAAGR